MKYIFSIAILLALVSCADGLRGPEGDPGVPGGILWNDADGRTVGHGDSVSVGYFDSDGLLWLIYPRTGMPKQPEINQLTYESDDCTGTPWETTALARIPVLYLGRYMVRPINARMAIINYGSARHLDNDECMPGRYIEGGLAAMRFEDYESLPGIPGDAVFTVPLYPVR